METTHALNPFPAEQTEAIDDHYHSETNLLNFYPIGFLYTSRFYTPLSIFGFLPQQQTVIPKNKILFPARQRADRNSTAHSNVYSQPHLRTLIAPELFSKRRKTLRSSNLPAKPLQLIMQTRHLPDN